MAEGSVARFASAIASAVQLGRGIDLRGKVEELKEKKAAAEQSLAELQEKICFYKKDISQLQELERVKELLSPSPLDLERQQEKETEETGTNQEEGTASLSTREGSNGSRDESTPKKRKSIVQRQNTVTTQEGTARVKPRLKDHIVTVLEDAGAMGLACLSTTDIVEWIVQKELWDWPNLESGRNSVRATCDTYPLIFIRVSPGTYGLKSSQQKKGQGSSKALTKEKVRVEKISSGSKRTKAIASANGSRDKPKQKKKRKTMTRKDAIVIVLQEAVAEGLKCLPVTDMIKRLQKKKLVGLHLKEGHQAYNAVSHPCRSNPGVFFKHAPGIFGLQSSQGRSKASSKRLTNNKFPKKKKQKVMHLRDCIEIVLEEAGRNGLSSENIVQMIENKKLYVWKTSVDKVTSVTQACNNSPHIFLRHAHRIYGLKSLQPGKNHQGSSKAPAKEKAHDEERDSERPSEATTGSLHESIQQRFPKECVDEPQSSVQSEERRLLLYTDDQKEAESLWNQCLLEQSRGENERDIFNCNRYFDFNFDFDFD